MDPAAPGGPPEATFHEAGAEQPIRSLPLSHWSIELGHLYFEDLVAGPRRMREHFESIAPWVAAARGIVAARMPGLRPRISTCFLLDDYFGSQSIPPAGVIPDLLAAAEAAGLQIDYLVREAGCAEADGVPLARLVEERIVADPAPRTTGSRPPATESGWLCNGQRTPQAAPAAMEDAAWCPPSQNGATRHSVFVDVEVWSGQDPQERVWSCAFLAAVWQLLRLGLIRYHGAPVAEPQHWDGDLPERWDALPAVMRVNRAAQPFAAYQALSVLPRRFLTTEHAVRTVLDQVAVERAVVGQVLDRAAGEGLHLPAEPTARIDYVFTG